MTTYRLTQDMLEELDCQLKGYHQLFKGDGCKGIQLEEFVFNALHRQPPPKPVLKWFEGSHNPEKDIEIRDGATVHLLQIKTGSVEKGNLRLSGHRFSGEDGDLAGVTTRLNNIGSQVISVAYKKWDELQVRYHEYNLRYIDSGWLGGYAKDNWRKVGEKGNVDQTNANGVKATVIPSMSWQVWWTIPCSKLEVAWRKVYETGQPNVG